MCTLPCLVTGMHVAPQRLVPFTSLGSMRNRHWIKLNLLSLILVLIRALDNPKCTKQQFK